MNQDSTDRKERWARKTGGKERNQLDLGLRPPVSLQEWRLHIPGQVENPANLGWADFMSLPQFRTSAIFIASQLGVNWAWNGGGVLFLALAE